MFYNILLDSLENMVKFFEEKSISLLLKPPDSLIPVSYTAFYNLFTIKKIYNFNK